MSLYSSHYWQHLFLVDDAKPEEKESLEEIVITPQGKLVVN